MVQVRRSTTKRHTTLVVSGSLVYREVSEVRVAFLAALEKRLPIKLDINVIEHVDLAGAQLVYALERSVAEAGLRLELVDGPGLARLRDLWDFAGLRPVGITRGV